MHHNNNNYSNNYYVIAGNLLGTELGMASALVVPTCTGLGTGLGMNVVVPRTGSVHFSWSQRPARLGRCWGCQGWVAGC